MMKRLLSLGAALSLVGCAALPAARKPPPGSSPAFLARANEHDDDGKRDYSRSELQDEIITADGSLENPARKIIDNDEESPNEVTAFPEVLAEVNNDVKKWIHHFSTREPERFNRFLRRGYTYKKLVQDILREKGIPEEFYYLAMIESGFTLHAKSHARAVGLWQFMAGTSSRYGLATNRYVDERRDPIRATYAAADYLRDLYNIFGSWHLAMAAYNAGEIRILRAIMKAKTRDFWALVEKSALPQETMDYVPKFLAAVIIGKSPKEFGLEDPSDEETVPEVVAIDVPSPVRLTSVAKVADMEIREVQRLNPHILRGITPPNVRRYKLWLPPANARLAARGRSSLEVQTASDVRRAPVVTTVAYRPADNRKEKLRTIARRYKMADKRTSRYRVRRGDTLQGIASRFGLSIQELKTLNRLKRNQIFAGQVLRVAGL